ncbi:MAG: type VI secretion system protein ImpK [Motiliproteus sp.]|jgi:type VI secretion system protein ImpK
MDDRTVIRPTPGGRRPRQAAVVAPRADAPAARAAVQPQYQPRHQPQQSPQGLDSIDDRVNPILCLLSPLLNLVGKVQHTHQHPDLDDFHRYALDQIRYYESRSWGLEGDPDAAFYTSYALCSLIDEMVLNTPWGSTSRWGSDSLLVNIHQEGWGGEKFFTYLDELLKRPASQLWVLEFYHVCLALGFEGHYRQQTSGQRDLARLQDELFTLIGRHRQTDEVELSPAWQGVSDQRNAVIRYVPYWVVWAVLGVALLGGYLSYSWQINQVSDRALRGLVELGQESALEVRPSNIINLQGSSRVEPDLRIGKTDYMALLLPALDAEIRSGVVELQDDANSTLIRLRHPRLFASGQSDISAQFLPLIETLAPLLRITDKPIRVAGHSDNVPIFSARFPSNWALSKARADSIGDILVAGLGSDARVQTEGMADMVPIVPNDSAKNRALNRRVEIVLRK